MSEYVKKRQEKRVKVVNGKKRLKSGTIAAVGIDYPNGYSQKEYLKMLKEHKGKSKKSQSSDDDDYSGERKTAKKRKTNSKKKASQPATQSLKMLPFRKFIPSRNCFRIDFGRVSFLTGWLTD